MASAGAVRGLWMLLAVWIAADVVWAVEGGCGAGEI